MEARAKMLTEVRHNGKSHTTSIFINRELLSMPSHPGVLTWKSILGANNLLHELLALRGKGHEEMLNTTCLLMRNKTGT